MFRDLFENQIIREREIRNKIGIKDDFSRDFRVTKERKKAGAAIFANAIFAEKAGYRIAYMPFQAHLPNTCGSLGETEDTVSPVYVSLHNGLAPYHKERRGSYRCHTLDTSTLSLPLSHC